MSEKSLWNIVHLTGALVFSKQGLGAGDHIQSCPSEYILMTGIESLKQG